MFYNTMDIGIYLHFGNDISKKKIKYSKIYVRKRKPWVEKTENSKFREKLYEQNL